MSVKIGVVGLGYVGLPLALGFAKKFPGTVGFDIDSVRVQSLREGTDLNAEEDRSALQNPNLSVTSNPYDLSGCNFFIVGVPTPVDENNNPDFGPLKSACATLGKVIAKGSIIVFESTVYPGVTEDLCGPWIEEASGLRQGVDFKLGYSPERINPGDKEHTLARIVKVVSGQDEETLNIVAQTYGAIITAGVHKASSIKVAEAAKVIENTQRDLNIALMNELAIILDRMSISTKDVLEAAATKWNFVKFAPGLVGGHCIGVDPYYLTTKAEQLGYHPQVILAGRRINDNMGFWIAQRIIKLMVHRGVQVKDARVGVLGITFKENVSDIRNSRVPDIISELTEFGMAPIVHDPLADPSRTAEEYGIVLSSWESMRDLDVVVIAVPHSEYRERGAKAIAGLLREGGIVADIKCVLDKKSLPQSVSYWCL